MSPKRSVIFSTLLVAGFLLLASGAGHAQSGRADCNPPLFPCHNAEDLPLGIKESLEKMRIAKEKKEYDEMVSRGEELVKLSDQLSTTFEKSGSLSKDDLSTVGKLEKLVKKIRDDLGGDDGEPDGEVSEPIPGSVPGAMAALKERSDLLHEQLKQMSRFTISASAIANTNALLKIARVLKHRN